MQQATLSNTEIETAPNVFANGVKQIISHTGSYLATESTRSHFESHYCCLVMNFQPSLKT